MCSSPAETMRGGAAMEIIADPADRVLGRRPFAEHRMHMAVDQPRQDRAAARIEHARRTPSRGGGSSAAMTPSSIERATRTGAIGRRDVAGKELADIGNADVLDDCPCVAGAARSLRRRILNHRGDGHVGRRGHEAPHRRRIRNGVARVVFGAQASRAQASPRQRVVDLRPFRADRRVACGRSMRRCLLRSDAQACQARARIGVAADVGVSRRVRERNAA